MNKICQKRRLLYKETTKCKFGGFTLIELLVVVLIIGILAAVALPKYQKAVWKARSSELLARAQAFKQTQEVYTMANGKSARRFEDLDIKLPVKPRTSNTNCNLTMTDSSYYGNIISAIVDPDNGVTGGTSLGFNLFLDGPYACAGYVYIPADTSYSGVTPGRVYCVERTASPFPGQRGDFCEKVMGAHRVGSIWRWEFYQLI